MPAQRPTTIASEGQVATARPSDVATAVRHFRERVDWNEVLSGFGLSVLFTLCIGSVLGASVWFATERVGWVSHGTVSESLSILVALWSSFLGFFAGISVAERHEHRSRWLNALLMFAVLAIAVTVLFAIDAALGFPLERALPTSVGSGFGIVHFTVMTALVGAFAATFLATGEEPGQEQMVGDPGEREIGRLHDPNDLH